APPLLPCPPLFRSSTGRGHAGERGRAAGLRGAGESVLQFGAPGGAGSAAERGFRRGRDADWPRPDLPQRNPGRSPGTVTRNSSGGRLVPRGSFRGNGAASRDPSNGYHGACEADRKSVV